MAEGRRRLSVLRLLALVGVVGAVGAVAYTQGSEAYDRITDGPSETWFAPYVDVTLTPTFHFEDPVVSPSANHVLSFVVADRRERCTPTWGTYYDLDGAGRALDLDRRVVRLRERGGDVVISFGGAVNDELAVACADGTKLLAGYRAVVDRYEARTLDFDIEGAALADRAAGARRAAAVAVLQDEAARDDRPLEIWLTLPVAPDGLTPEGVATVEEMLDAGVELAGVNVMTMNYGGSRTGGRSMAEANEAALRATHAQLDRALRARGVALDPAALWARIGATPMIGRNDVETDRFTVGDARALVAFADEVALGRVSMWSANRDDRCGVQSDEARVSNTCSGVDQDTLEFTWELGRLNGPLPERTAVVPTESRAQAISRDDPSMSPYPIWRAAKAYERGAKVVWHGSVYEAKWWTQGDLPDEQVARLWDTPWRYVGPVLESDRPPVRERVAGRNPRWSAEQVYLKGDRVAFEGFVYEAKWYTQGTEPDPDPDRPTDVPWTLIGRGSPDVQTVPGNYPAWRPARTYLPGARIMHRGYVFESRWWTKGFPPDPDPSKPDQVPWEVLGRVRAGR